MTFDWEKERDAAWDVFHKQIEDICSRYPYDMKMNSPQHKAFLREKAKAGKQVVEAIAKIFWKRAELSAPGAR